MAAGTSLLEFPMVFERYLLDDDASSCSEYYSLASDSCGILAGEPAFFTRDCVIHILECLDKCEKVSLMFLLCDDVEDALNRLLSPDPEMLANWLREQNDGMWEEKLIEALCIIQNYEVLEHLVDDVADEKRRFAPNMSEYTVNISRIRKCLYLMCEKMSADELEKLVEGMRTECRGLSRRFGGELMELNLLHWASAGYISLGDSEGQGVNLEKLKLILKRIGKSNYLDCLESQFIIQDGPSPPSVMSSCSSKRLVLSMGTSLGRPKRKRCNYIYQINPKNVGICLIINQKNFYKEENPRFYRELVNGNLETRFGTDLDRDRLNEMFLSMNFITIIKENLKHTEVLAEIEHTVNNIVTKQHSCFVLCILSHGVRGMVYGTNSVAVYKEDLENLLKGAPVLIGKPKTMIIQACQGEEFQKVVFESSLVGQADVSMDGPSEEDPLTKGIGESADILTFWSTVPGYASIRHHFNGSWFVETLWQHFMGARDTEDICTLFTRVTSDLSNRKEFIDESYKTMVPQYRSSLTGQLVLPLHPDVKQKVALLLFQRFMFQRLVKEYIFKLRKRDDGTFYHITN